MPSGEMPTYDYRPAKSIPPKLKTYSSIRARLFGGGTYFRAIEPGREGNRISVWVNDEIFVVTNYNLVFKENVTGPATVDFLDLKVKSGKAVIIDQLHTTSPRAAIYSISFKIAPAETEYVLDSVLGVFAFGKLFSAPGKISVKLSPGATVFTATDKIIITQRHSLYALEELSVTDPLTMVTSEGWDIDLLRAAINADDPWIEMMARGTDQQDLAYLTDPIGEVVGTALPETLLFGGDGLPTHPAGELTGPSRSLIHVNYGEQLNGALGETNTIHEWVGESAKIGTWKTY